MAPESPTITFCPAATFGAPQTIWSSSVPVLTLHTESLSALGCFATSSTSPITNLSYFSPNRSMLSTSRPTIVSFPASSSGGIPTGVYFLSQLREINISELLQEPDVVIEQQSNIVDAVAEHSNALDPHAESIAAVTLFFIPNEIIDIGIDHAAAKDFEPAGLLAYPASFAFAKETCNIHLRARLGKREITGTETIFQIRTIELFCKGDKRSFQFAKCYAAIDVQTFDLMEQTVTARAYRLVAINASGDNHPHGRFLFFHDTNLYRRGVRSQNDFFFNKEGVLHIARRMIGWEI